MTASAVLTTTQVAEKLKTDPKTLRKFFRSDKCDIEPVGQGKRYAITQADIKELEKAFAAWVTPRAKKADTDEAETPAPKVKKTTKKSSKVTVVEEDTDEELDLEPTAEDLSDIDDDELEDLDI